MMKNTMKYTGIITAALTLLGLTQVNAQDVNFDGQILQRSEFRNGFGTLRSSESNPAFSIGQRSRINFNLEDEKLSMKVSVQDVRIWGNTPQVKVSDAFFSVYEAYGEYQFTEQFSFKAGRQELAYDDHRFLGNLDWALQGRSHDMALIKFEKERWKIHGGAAYNQDELTLTGNFYPMPNQYKAAQFVRWEQEFGKFAMTAMVWNNGLQYHETDDQGVRHEQINYSQTIGLPALNYKLDNWWFNAFYYHQIGVDDENNNMNAFDAGAQVSYFLHLNTEKERLLRFTAGGEVLSGNDEGTDDAMNRAFNPFYGTNHRFNGYMDYFYVGGRHLNSVGLQDYFFKVRYDLSPKVFISSNNHFFQSYGSLAEDPQREAHSLGDNFLGFETDFTAGIKVSESFTVQLGYSQMFGSQNLQHLRGGDHTVTNNWAYAALLYRPGMNKPFTGLKF